MRRINLLVMILLTGLMLFNSAALAVPMPPLIMDLGGGAISPVSGSAAGGNIVSISGMFLDPPTAVTFGGQAATLLPITSNAVVSVIAPPGLVGSVDVIVMNAGGSSAVSPPTTTYTYLPPPVITTVSPQSGFSDRNIKIIIKGSGFTGANQVIISNCTPQYFIVDSDTQITALTNTNIVGTGDIVVTTAVGSSATTAADKYTFVPPPLISFTAPATGSPAGGQSIVIIGSGFTNTSSVTFDGSPIPFTVANDMTINITTPARTDGAVDISVTATLPDGTTATGSIAQAFTYKKPVVSTIGTTTGSLAGGSGISINGSGFTDATAVKFGTVSATSFYVFDDYSLSATVPPGIAGTVDVTVVVGPAVSAVTSSAQYTYIAEPVITGISTANKGPASGTTKGGTSVYLYGYNFTGATAVMFGANPASFIVQSDSTIVAKSPPGAVGIVDISVTGSKGTSSVTPASEFTYFEVPAIDSIYPDNGSIAGGTKVTISGVNFTGTSGVDGVMFGNINAASYTVDSDTQITAITTSYSVSTLPVTVRTDKGVSQDIDPKMATSLFTYNNAYGTVDGTYDFGGYDPRNNKGGSFIALGDKFKIDFNNIEGSISNISHAITAIVPASSNTAPYKATIAAEGGATCKTFTFNDLAITAFSPALTDSTRFSSLDVVFKDVNGATIKSLSLGASTADIPKNALIKLSELYPTAALTVDNVAIIEMTIAMTTNGQPVQAFELKLENISIANVRADAAVPQVYSASPAFGATAGGTEVTIRGADFSNVSAVNFGTLPAASFTYVSPTEIKAITPAVPAAGSANLTVTTSLGSSSNSAMAMFNYQAPAVVTSISPSSGSMNGGTEVIITGSGFSGSSKLLEKSLLRSIKRSSAVVSFGNTVTDLYRIDSDTQITAISPPGAGAVHVSVNVGGVTSVATPADIFTYPKLDQSITFGAAPTITAGALGSVSAAASSGLALTYSSLTPSVCFVAGTNVTGNKVGSCIVAADQAGNDSYNPAPQATLAVAIIADTTLPVITSFSIPTTASSLRVNIDNLTATDDVRLAGYYVGESATQPSAANTGIWYTYGGPKDYLFANQGIKTLYAFAKDEAGNVSVPKSATVTIDMGDIIPPVVTSFAIPPTSSSLDVPITAFEYFDNVAGTNWAISESANVTAGDTNQWQGRQAAYRFDSAGKKTLYAYAMDDAGNVSAPLSATVVITLPDGKAPNVTSFTIPANSNSLTVPVTALDGTDDTGITDWILSENQAVAANDYRWVSTSSIMSKVVSKTLYADIGGTTAYRPTSYTFTSQGAKTLYAFAKDAAGNISASLSANVTITLADQTAPTVSSFVIPASSDSLTVAVASFSVTDDTGVTGYLLSESATASAASGNWTSTPTSSYTFASAGSKTIYAFAKDAVGNVSLPASATVLVSLADISRPQLSAFTASAVAAQSLTVQVSGLAATDDTGVTGYILSEAATAPAFTVAGWDSVAPTSYTFPSGGTKTLYAYAKDAAGNVSDAVTTGVTVSHVVRNGNSSNSAKPELADVLRALHIYLDSVKNPPTGDDMIRYDVAPLDNNGIPLGDGKIDSSDILMILRRIIEIGNW